MLYNQTAVFHLMNFLVMITRHCESHLKLMLKSISQERNLRRLRLLKMPMHHLISSLSQRNNRDIKEISFMIFLSNGHTEILAASLTLRVLS